MLHLEMLQNDHKLNKLMWGKKNQSVTLSCKEVLYLLCWYTIQLRAGMGFLDYSGWGPTNSSAELPAIGSLRSPVMPVLTNPVSCQFPDLHNLICIIFGKLSNHGRSLCAFLLNSLAPVSHCPTFSLMPPLINFFKSDAPLHAHKPVLLPPRSSPSSPLRLVLVKISADSSSRGTPDSLSQTSHPCDLAGCLRSSPVRLLPFYRLQLMSLCLGESNTVTERELKWESLSSCNNKANGTGRAGKLLVSLKLLSHACEVTASQTKREFLHLLRITPFVTGWLPPPWEEVTGVTHSISGYRSVGPAGVHGHTHKCHVVIPRLMWHDLLQMPKACWHHLARLSDISWSDGLAVILETLWMTRGLSMMGVCVWTYRV